MTRGIITFLGTIEGDIRYDLWVGNQDTGTAYFCVRIDKEVFSYVQCKGKIAFLLKQNDVKPDTKIMVSGCFAPRLAEADVIASEIILVDEMKVLSNE